MARITLISVIFSLVVAAAFAQAPGPAPTISPPKLAPLPPPIPSPPTKAPSPSPIVPPSPVKSPAAAPVPAPPTPSPTITPSSSAVPPSGLISPVASPPGVSDNNSAAAGFSSFGWISAAAAIAVACAI